GMVGALSIVRFRTAVKEAIDIVYMFWAIATGIAIGAGFYFIASVSCVGIGLIIYAMSKLTSNENAFVLVVTADGSAAQSEIEGAFKNKVKRSQFKAKSNHQGCSEYTYEVRLQKNNSSFTEELSKVAGVQAVSLVGFKTQNYL
ncbi:MAG: DUF4956 domain-containing protein, partial [Clostridia bacterium]|nr:DUF4956 domain-containing protein [Clostridia bacterium]